jgi:uracil-DNA glycosylase
VNTHKQAIELASAHLRDEGSALVARQNGLRRDKRLGLWHVDYYDPEHPDELLCGGSLAVWDDGRVESVGSSPSERDMIDAEGRFRQSLVDALSLPDDWHELLGGECYKPYWETLQIFLRDERRQHTVYPPEEQVFSAFRFTRYADTRVVILGQDPYHQPGQAHGLCFSVPEGITRPPALINIHKELHSDLGIGPPEHGNLESWARQGVLLLNMTLTVQRDEPNAHHGRGWETFTDEVIKAVNEKSSRVVFILWGAAARSKKKLIDTTRHGVVEAAHPTSWPNAHDPFLGSQPFSKANRFLEEAGVAQIAGRLSRRDRAVRQSEAATRRYTHESQGNVRRGQPRRVRPRSAQRREARGRDAATRHRGEPGSRDSCIGYPSPASARQRRAVDLAVPDQSLRGDARGAIADCPALPDAQRVDERPASPSR